MSKSWYFPNKARDLGGKTWFAHGKCDGLPYRNGPTISKTDHFHQSSKSSSMQYKQDRSQNTLDAPNPWVWIKSSGTRKWQAFRWPRAEMIPGLEFSWTPCALTPWISYTQLEDTNMIYHMMIYRAEIYRPECSRNVGIWHARHCWHHHQ